MSCVGRHRERRAAVGAAPVKVRKMLFKSKILLPGLGKYDKECVGRVGRLHCDFSSEVQKYESIIMVLSSDIKV